MKRAVAHLTDLKDGQNGIIVNVDPLPMMSKEQKETSKRSTGPKLLCAQRLMDLGLTPGTKVVVVKSAPWCGSR